MNTEQTIVFYDGVCGLCTRSVQLLLKLDRHHRLKFSPLQGTTYQSLTNTQQTSFDSIVVYSQSTFFTEVKALQHIGKTLGGFWNVLRIISFIIPPFISNALYRLIAKNRYQIFGKHDHCHLPTPAQREQFLG
ncbi:MAG: DUF393 domain-containing protein [Candidatus Kapabacteria bacterium]|nr:DUF393 domain-containing protein [Candidatus Kapabacteria bacterium]